MAARDVLMFGLGAVAGGVAGGLLVLLVAGSPRTESPDEGLRDRIAELERASARVDAAPPPAEPAPHRSERRRSAPVDDTDPDEGLTAEEEAEATRMEAEVERLQADVQRLLQDANRNLALAGAREAARRMNINALRQLPEEDRWARARIVLDLTETQVAELANAYAERDQVWEDSKSEEITRSESGVIIAIGTRYDPVRTKDAQRVHRLRVDNALDATQLEKWHADGWSDVFGKRSSYRVD